MAAAIGTGEPIVAINVTPFVDVVLVLLIIFMATANHIVKPTIEVDLPEAASAGETVETTVSLVLAANGELFLNGEPSDESAIAAYCRTGSAENPKLQAMIAADGKSRHEQVVQLIDLVKLNGISSFALNIDPAARAPGEEHHVRP